jgi:hypothetical protein
MFKKSGEALSPTALNLLQGNGHASFCFHPFWLAGIPLFPCM